MSALIYHVEPDSLAEQKGIRKGWTLLTINGEPINDILEYRFLCCDERVTLGLLNEHGKRKKVTITNQYEDLGISFENPLIDLPRSCKNRCIFCFIDQLPPGMRDTLYFKDDDTRLSFLHGNYVTLTNVTDQDLESIVKTRITPINISVHTTDPALRIKMLNNRFAGDIMDKMRFLAEHRITMNCQIVACPHINDGEKLAQTVRDLATLYPAVHSISVVPVGLSRFREGLYPLAPYDREMAICLLREVESLQKECYEALGTRLLYAADEFYLKAHLPVPSGESYEGFPQIENGVGMIRSFADEIEEALQDVSVIPKKSFRLATGMAAADFMKQMAEKIEQHTGIQIQVYPIENRFFGSGVTVAGLLTAQDIIHQLEGKDLKDGLILSQNMLKADEDVFLDDMSLNELEERLHTHILCMPDNGEEFIDKLLQENDL